MSDIEILCPNNRAEWLAMRRQDITASAAGALFGIHDYLTPYELWAEKTGRLPETHGETDAMRRGRLLEPVAVQMLCEDRPGWKIEHGSSENVYYRDPAARLGGTPDVRVFCPNRGPGVVQIKSVESMIFRKKWKVEGDVEAPLWIALQASIEAHLTGARWAAVAPLVVGFGLDMPIIDIPLNPALIEAVKEEVAGFWAMIARGEEPKPDYGRDGALIARLYPEAAAGTVIDLSESNRLRDLLMSRQDVKETAKEAEAVSKGIDAELKHMMGACETAIVPGGKRMTLKTTQRAGFTVEPTSYRTLRCPTI